MTKDTGTHSAKASRAESSSGNGNAGNVFVSDHWRDHAAVESVARALKHGRLLARWCLAPEIFDESANGWLMQFLIDPLADRVSTLRERGSPP